MKKKKPPKLAVDTMRELDQYLDYMKDCGKQPSALYVKPAQKKALDKAAQITEEGATGATPESIKAARFNEYRGLPVKVVG